MGPVNPPATSCRSTRRPTESGCDPAPMTTTERGASTGRRLATSDWIDRSSIAWAYRSEAVVVPASGTRTTISRTSEKQVDWTGSPRSLSTTRSEEHTSELQSRRDLVCRLLLEKKKKKYSRFTYITRHYLQSK